MEIYKKVALGIIGAVISCGLLVGTANAFLCKNADVARVEMRPSIVAPGHAVWVKCEGYGNPKRFFFNSQLGEAGYATALTALSLGRKVEVTTAGTAWNSLITDFTILPTAP